MKQSLKLLAQGLLVSLPVASFTAAETITVWAWDPNFNIDIMNRAAKIYQEKNPKVKFEIVDFAKADVEQKLLTNLASGVTSNLPDIVLIEDYNAQKYLQAFPGSFADLTKKFDYSDFAPYKVELMSVDGKVYGVPFDSGVAGMFYRTDIIEKAGYSGKDLHNITWDRFVEIGKDVKAKTGVDMISYDAADSGALRIMLNSSGSWYFDENGRPDVQTPAMEASLEAWKKLYQSGTMRISNGWGDWVSGFQQGEVATVVTGVWIIGSIKSAADQAGKWAVAPAPRLDMAGSVNASNLGGSSWYILDSSKEKKEAIKFMEATFGSDSDFYQQILVNNGAVGSYLPSQKVGAYAEADAFFGGQKVFADFSDWMKKIPAVSYGMYTYEVSDAITAQMPAVVDESKSIKDALKAAQAQSASQIQ